MAEDQTTGGVDGSDVDDSPGGSVPDGSELILGGGGPDSAADPPDDSDDGDDFSAALRAEKTAKVAKGGQPGGDQSRQAKPGSAKPIPPQFGQRPGQQPSQQRPGQQSQQNQQGQHRNLLNQDGSVHLNGRKFNNLDHAAQVLHAQSERAAAESRGKEELRTQLGQAVETIKGLQALIKQTNPSFGTGGVAPQSAPAAAAPQTAAELPKKFSELLSNEAVRFLTEHAGTPAAFQYLAQHVDTFVADQVKAGIEAYKAEIAPTLDQIRSFQTDQATVTAATNLWMRAAQMRDQFGNLLYPEVSQDSAAAHAITSFWKQLPPELAYSDQGVRISYLMYKDEQSRAAMVHGQPLSTPGLPGVNYPDPSQDLPVVIDGDGSPAPGEQLTPRQRRAREELAVFRAGNQRNENGEVFLGVSR